jgi:hypothetical protein
LMKKRQVTANETEKGSSRSNSDLSARTGCPDRYRELEVFFAAAAFASSARAPARMPTIE